ncbi:Nramp family divalent metal transporter [Actinophytocola sp.]|uniref:Nramp family divalent metal transporter n=1 Tax=Actinophytocola sp. TaxID=1872138 RepID=UPI00389A9ADC
MNKQGSSRQREASSPGGQGAESREPPHSRIPLEVQRWILTTPRPRGCERLPRKRDLIENGDRSAALQAMSDSFASVGGQLLGALFFCFISLIGVHATLGLFDSFSRGQADMTYFHFPGATRFTMSHLYAGFLWTSVREMEAMRRLFLLTLPGLAALFEAKERRRGARGLKPRTGTH